MLRYYFRFSKISKINAKRYFYKFFNVKKSFGKLCILNIFYNIYMHLDVCVCVCVCVCSLLQVDCFVCEPYANELMSCLIQHINNKTRYFIILSKSF